MNDHERLSSLAAWHANGTLAGEDREQFERHLEGCAECRQEVELCRELAQSYPASDAPAPHPAQVARLLDRIVAGAAEALPGEPPARRSRARALFAATPRPVRWLVAAQVALALVTGAYLVSERREPAPQLFRTLSDAPAGSPGDLRVVFVPEAGEVEIRRLLLGTRAEIVGGPTPVGAYTIALDRSPAGATIEDAIELLRSSSLVRLAEPIGGMRAAKP